MRQVDVSEDIHDTLQRLAERLYCTPDEVLASLLTIPRGSPEGTASIAAFVLGAEFRASFAAADKYLALLAWLATHHRAELGEFIFSQSSGRRFLGLSREEILAACRQNEARQIDGTQYWAIMNIEPAMKRRFLTRAMEFIGYRDAVIELVCSAAGLVGRRSRRLALAE